MSSDAAYTLAMHLLAAELNMTVGSEICNTAIHAAQQGRTLLCNMKLTASGPSNVNFRACGNYLKSSGYTGTSGQYAKALCIKDCLEKFNMGNLCPSGTCTACAGFTWASNYRDNPAFDEFMTNTEMIASFPNPMNDNATIVFAAGENTRAVMELYSVTGAKVAVLLDRDVNEGELVEIPFNAESLTTGMYFCKLVMGGNVYTHKIIVNK
jgi:hypothetical protein